LALPSRLGRYLDHCRSCCRSHLDGGPVAPGRSNEWGNESGLWSAETMRVTRTRPRRKPAHAGACLTLLAALVVAPSLGGAATAGTPVPGASGCPMFPADNVWNADISGMPVHPRSGRWMRSMSASASRLHPDLGPSYGDQPLPYGIPYTVVDGSHPTTTVSFTYGSESDPGPYPLGRDTPVEGGPSAGGDRHSLIVNRGTCTLCELYDAHWGAAGSTAGSGAVWDLRSNALRPAGWTSADAAGLPILPGLLRLDEVRSGLVSHAIRFTAARTDRSYVWPASHQAGAAADPDLPPMGARFRLQASFDTSRYLPETQVVLRAMQRHGMILADNGSNWYLTGSADEGWDERVIAQLKSIPASAFEAIDESSLMVSPGSGAVRTTGAVNGVDIPSGLPRDGGYWLVASDGGIFAFGRAAFHGSTGGMRLNRPIVGMAPTPSGRGYWLVASDGGIFAFGDARFLGSTGAMRLSRPVVGMAATPDGAGYWLVASDGGIFAFGSARFHGSTGATKLVRPIVGMAPTPTGLGYRLAASDGGVFAFGDATFEGSDAATPSGPTAAVAGAPAPAGAGYWLATAAGGVHAFGAARSHGSLEGAGPNRPVVGFSPSPAGSGYRLATADGGVFCFGDAGYLGSTGNLELNRPVVGLATLPG
jgi:hypothetical protein